ncbi:XrtA system polysaccharide chain length determinant [Altererythrobacter sp. CAU 1778]
MNQIFEELRSAAYSVWHRRWLVIAVAWGICALGWLAVAMVPNSYESRARLFVQLDDVLADQIGIGAGSRQRDIERVRQTLVSAVNLEQVIKNTRIGETVTSPREMQIAIERLAKDISVKSEQDDLFEITAASGRSELSEAENAVLAQDIVTKMIDIFREENLTSGRGEMSETLDFLDQQLAARQKELEAAEQSRLAFEAQHPDLMGGATAIASKLDTTRTELRGVEADLAAAQSALASINGQLAGTPRTIAIPGGAESGPAAGLAQAQANLAGLWARGLTDSHPDVVAARKQVELMREQQLMSGGGGTSSMPNPAYSSLLSIKSERDANLQALNARRAALQSEIMATTASQSAEPAVAAEAQRISRDYEVLQKKYEELLQDREELKLRGQVETERSAIKFEVIDPPTAPRSPAAPNRPLWLFGVLVLGIAGGIGAGFAISLLRNTFATAGKLEDALDLPVLGTISMTFNQAGRELRRKRARQFAGACAGLGGMFVLLLVVEFAQRVTVA